MGDCLESDSYAICLWRQIGVDMGGFLKCIGFPLSTKASIFQDPVPIGCTRPSDFASPLFCDPRSLRALSLCCVLLLDPSEGFVGVFW